MVCNITAATGELGKRIVEEALRVIRPEDLVLTVRNLKKAEPFLEKGVTLRKGDYNDEEELTLAFCGTDLLVYIPSLAFPSLPRVLEFEKAISAAKRAGVGHIIYIGFFADQETTAFQMGAYYGYAHRRLASSGLAYTYVRNAMYADPLPAYLPELVAMGRLPYPAGEGRVSFIPRQEIAKAVARLMAEEGLRGETYTLTGKRSYDMAELAGLLSEASGKPIIYEPMAPEVFAATYDEPEGFGEVLASLYVAVSQGGLGAVTEDFRAITKEEPEDLLEFLRREYRRVSP